MRNKTSSTLLTISATAIALLLLASPVLPLSSLLQPAQAQTNLSFRTPTPANGTSSTTETELSFTFDAQGTSSSIDPQSADITSGTMEITEGGQRAYSGSIQGGEFTNNTSGGIVSANGPIDPSGDTFYLDAPCSTSVNNGISVDIQIRGGGGTLHFNGPVECSPSQGGDTTRSSMTGTAHDSDGDGIHDSSDKCPHNSNHRCFKDEGTTTTTTSTDQQQPSSTSSSSSSSGNQTRQGD